MATLPAVFTPRTLMPVTSQRTAKAVTALHVTLVRRAGTNTPT